MEVAVTVRASEIHGIGVFAEAVFEAGDFILTIDDSYVVDETHRVPAGEEHYCDYLECGKTVLMQVPERHINHSCEPNVFVRTVGGERRLFALRDIKPGEEMAYDYCVNSYGEVVWTCDCGALRCRGTIHSDFFHLPLDLQREYLPLLDEWFQRERALDLDELKTKLAESGR